jgi:phage-related minor tail protein
MLTQDELKEAKITLEIKVQARTDELRKLAETLDEQVKQRTKELQEKLRELEKFREVAVGRELKMIELKKEIGRTKEDRDAVEEIGKEKLKNKKISIKE